MNHEVTIGRTGLTAFKLGFGAGVVGNSMMYPKVDDALSRQLIQSALEKGINFIDTAFLYGMGHSEELIGEAIRAHGGRERLVISTKASANPQFSQTGLEVDNSPAALRKSVDDSLMRLQTDYIDIFFLHFPDSRTPLSEAADTLAELKKSGKIKAIGASNLSFEQLQEFNANQHLDVLQAEYSLLVRQAEADVIPYCLEHEISLIPFFPLASGLLAGKYKKDDVFHDVSRMNNPLFQKEAYVANLERVDRFKAFAQAKGAEPAQIALAWLLTRPAVHLIIPGATKPDQMDSNLQTLNVQLSEEELKQLDVIFN
ncbi:Predicted oxidoreductase [Paenibacillus algorifonticola]|uniref:Predicted oxidoreductase n=1 Tax=Paenibacillus algorifonticola TaxID=684063 RepID=A0A1I2ID09_9BACL|nr:aldo/keto reductase [Paenibacillus algorifonticola]SFF39538.1 Predicted oxidoreductase [Paenibacillus algorifonticola]